MGACDPSDPDNPTNPDEPTDPDGPTTPTTPTGPSTPATFTLEDVQLGVSGPAGSTEVREGTHFWVAGRVATHGGTPIQWPKLTVHADMNSNGSIDEGELFTSESHSHEWFYAYFTLVDDGPSTNPDGAPGNGTPTDAFNITVTLIDYDFEVLNATAVNVAPSFTNHPNLTFEQGENGRSIAAITVSGYHDPGVRDDHTLEVVWADGGPVIIAGDDCDEVVNPCPTKDESIRSERVFESRFAQIYPITMTLKDDDTGTAKYRIDKVDVMVNYNDDNVNGVDDREEQSFADQDIRELNLSSFLTSEMDPATGYFELSFGSNIKLWDSQTKSNVYVSGGGAVSPDGAPDSLPTIEYAGQDKVFVEGVQVGQTTIRLAWFPNDWTGTLDDSGNRPIYAGSVVTRVWKLDLDIDSDNNNGFDFPKNSAWEEELEDHSHAIGKMIIPNTHYTPMRLRLPPGLDAYDPSIEVKITRSGERKSGLAVLTPGGDLYYRTSFTLQMLQYDPVSGGVTMWIDAVFAWREHDKLVEVEED